MAIPVARIKTKIDSKKLHLEKGRSGVTAHSTTTGAMIKVPVASISHQVTKVTTESAKPILFARTKPASATLDLIIAVGAKEMNANLAMLEGVANVFGPFDQRPSSQAPTSAARTVPTTMEPVSNSDWLTIR